MPWLSPFKLHWAREMNKTFHCYFFVFSCSRDNTLDYRYEKSAQQFFNLAAFRFKEGYDDVYIHCKMTVCRSDDAGSRCDRGCGDNRRRRRSTEEDMSAELYIGPLKTKKITNEPGKYFRQINRFMATLSFFFMFAFWQGSRKCWKCKINDTWDRANTESYSSLN